MKNEGEIAEALHLITKVVEGEIQTSIPIPPKVRQQLIGARHILGWLTDPKSKGADAINDFLTAARFARIRSGDQESFDA